MLLILPASIFANSNVETSLVSGYQNVEFSNGYKGFCIDYDLKSTIKNDVFIELEDTSSAKNNDNGRDVSQKLKILFTQHFEEIFLPDGNGDMLCHPILKNQLI